MTHPLSWAVQFSAELYIMFSLAIAVPATSLDSTVFSQ